MNDTDRLRFAYFPDWSNPTVLFWGSRTMLVKFAELLSHWCEAPSRDETVMNDLSWVEPRGGIRLSLKRVNKGPGLQRTRGAKAEFVWELAPADAEYFAELVAVVANEEVAGHHYLDSRFDDVQVVVSRGEYPDDMIP